jgi:hypothetical protein
MSLAAVLNERRGHSPTSDAPWKIMEERPTQSPQTPERDDSEVREIKRGIWMGIATAVALLLLVILAAKTLSTGGYFVDASGNFTIERVCAKSVECDPSITVDGCRARYQMLQDRTTLSKAQLRERSIVVQCLHERDMETGCQEILECIATKSQQD